MNEQRFLNEPVLPSDFVCNYQILKNNFLSCACKIYEFSLIIKGNTEYFMICIVFIPGILKLCYISAGGFSCVLSNNSLTHIFPHTRHMMDGSCNDELGFLYSDI